MTPSLFIPRASLVFCGLMYLLLGLVLGPLGGLAFLAEADSGGSADGAINAIFAVIMMLVCGGVGIANLVAAWGLGGGSRKWAWFLSIILGFIYVPSGCLPFGLAIVWPLWQQDVKDHFGV